MAKETSSYREASSAGRDSRRGSRRNWLIEYVIIFAVAFGLVFGFIRPFVVQAYVIPSASMEPTLHGCTGCTNDRVLANKFIYRFTDPKRGDIVVFKSVTNPNEDLIKRVIGLPGDTIAVRNGKIVLNGKPQEESYVVNKPCVPGLPKTCSFGPVTVPKGHYFMMGDNRGNSEDSRYFGPVPKKNIEGEAFLRFWPLNRIGWL
ncbi:MAG: signal peptidase I [Rubrobacteraceae bacterium]